MMGNTWAIRKPEASTVQGMCVICKKRMQGKASRKNANNETCYMAACHPCENKRKPSRRNYKKGSKRTTQRSYEAKFGLKRFEVQSMMRSQKHCCAICGKHKKLLSDKVLCLDHCHKSGKSRGFLCRKCNVALGMVEDNIKTIKNMIRYLKDHS